MVAWLAVPDPEIEIRRGGGHLDPEIRGVGLFGPQFGLKVRGSWSKNKGEPPLPGRSPGSATG